MTLAIRLFEARKAARMTQAQLAKKAKLTAAAVSLLEAGQSKGIAGENVFPIADALGVSARWLLTGGQPSTKDDVPMDREKRASMRRLIDHLETLDETKVIHLFGLLGIRYSD